jgi:tetratricopeptide (TPR) repeat protein
MALYHLALVLEREGDSPGAVHARRQAAGALADRAFPYGLDDHDALVAAIAADPLDGRARAMLAMLLYDRGRTAEALELWRAAIGDGLLDPVALRNAAIATYNMSGDASEAAALYERALALAPLDARLWYESDQLLARAGMPADARLRRLDPAIVFDRDDLTVEYCELLVATGRAAEAVGILESRPFAPWEGGEGRALAVWENACLDLARCAKDPAQALAYVDRALVSPPNLGEARHPLAPAGRIEAARLAALAELGGIVEFPEAVPSVEPGANSTPDYFATSLPELLLFNPPAGEVI